MASECASKGSCPRSRNLLKKLAQIAALEERASQGLELSADQYAKVDRRAEYEEELRQLEAEPEEVVLESEQAEAKEAVLDTEQGQEPEIQEQLDQADTEQAPIEQNSPQREPLRLPAEICVQDEAVVDAVARAELAECASPCSPNTLRQRSHSERWEDDPVAVEDIAPTPKCSVAKVTHVESELLEDVKPFGTSSKGSERLGRLLRAAAVLSQEAFETDVMEGVSRKGKWKLTLLAQLEDPQTGPDASDPWGGLLGFISYKTRPQLQCVSISKLAVVPEHRGNGHGHKIVQWIIALARKQPNITFISLSSLPKAEKFYKQIGFRKVDVDMKRFDDAAEDEEFDYVEGQVYMEYRCKGRGAKKRR